MRIAERKLAWGARGCGWGRGVVWLAKRAKETKEKDSEKERKQKSKMREKNKNKKMKSERCED